MSLDLDRIKAAVHAKQQDFDPTHPGYVPWCHKTHHLTSQACVILNAAPDLIAEVERLTQELADAKAVGAAEELERMAANKALRFEEYGSEDDYLFASEASQRAAEIRKGITK